MKKINNALFSNIEKNWIRLNKFLICKKIKKKHQ